MRGLPTIIICVLAATATAAKYSNATCATGLYILCARGSGEPAISAKGQYPDNTGSPGTLALEVAKQVQGSVIAGVIYPARDPISAAGDVDLNIYYPSENAGTKAILEQINEYHSSCPSSKIALIGYSQVCATDIEPADGVSALDEGC
jgi:hypothetical protein